MSIREFNPKKGKRNELIKGQTQRVQTLERRWDQSPRSGLGSVSVSGPAVSWQAVGSDRSPLTDSLVFLLHLPSCFCLWKLLAALQRRREGGHELGEPPSVLSMSERGRFNLFSTYSLKVTASPGNTAALVSGIL